MAELIRQSEFARRVGKSAAWINKLIKAGKISVGDNKLIDYESALVQLEGSKDYNRDPQRQHAAKVRAQKTMQAIMTERKGEGETVETVIGQIYDHVEPPIGDPACKEVHIGIETQKSKLARETYEAKIKQLEYLKMIGELIPIDEVKKANEIIAASIRSKLLTLPTKLAPRIEGKQAVEIQYMLEDAINEVLIEFYARGNNAEN